MANGDEKKSPAFYERRQFKGAVAVLGVITALLAIAGPLRSAVSGLFPAGTPPSLNAEVIFDTSAAMGKTFDGREKRREASLEALRASRFWPNEGVALRRTEPGCGDDTSDLLVPFDTDHTAEVYAVAKAQRPGGKSNLIAAVSAAMAELAEPPYDDDPPSSKRVLVFTAGLDRCAPDPVGELEQLVGGSGPARARSEFKLFGLNLSPKERRQLHALGRALERSGAYAKVWTPSNFEQLYRAVEAMNEEAESRPGLPEPEETVPREG